MIISSRRSMRILVVPREGRRPLFYYEPSIDDAPTPDSSTDRGGPHRQSRFRAWVGRCVDGARHLEHHVPGRLQAPIAWLKSRLPADERLLMALRHADRLVFVHPPSLAFEDLKSFWAGYLESRFQRRMIWFVVYLLLFIPSILLAVLPGPNVVGFWVTYRLVAHGMVLYSLIRASRDRLVLESELSEILDGPIFTDRRAAERVQSRFHLFGLKKQIRRARIWQRLLRRRSPRQVASSRVEG